MSFKDPILQKMLRKAKTSLVANRSNGPVGNFKINHDICDKFKGEFTHKTKQERIDELRRLSNIKIKNNISYKERRSKVHRGRGRKCWVCRCLYAYCQHHIIQLKNGGYDNGINRIAICHVCHELIHDHMAINRIALDIKSEVDAAINRDQS